MLELAFMPALPLTLLGGLAFGSLWGVVYVSAAATLSAALASLVARYMARGAVEQSIARHARLARIDAAAAAHGWRIRLTVVDYQAVKADAEYAAALRDLATATPESLRTESERLAFWINAYNLLAIKTVVDQYPTASIRDGGTLLRSMWKKKIGLVAGKGVALDDIGHGILRKAFREPRVHFAIVCASVSCPDPRTEPYVAERLNAQLDDAARTFLGNPTKGLVPGPEGKTANVSSIFKWFGGDFDVVGGVSTFIRTKADPAVAARLAGLTDAGLSYLEYDWSLNDSARTQK